MVVVASATFVGAVAPGSAGFVGVVGGFIRAVLGRRTLIIVRDVFDLSSIVVVADVNVVVSAGDVVVVVVVVVSVSVIVAVVVVAVVVAVVVCAAVIAVVELGGDFGVTSDLATQRGQMNLSW